MGRKLIVSCKFGGEFQQGEYGVQYNGGEAYAIEVDEEISFDTFRARVVAKCGLNEKGSLIALKYYLPTNNTTLISLRDDSDMKIFVNLFKDSISSDIYVQKLDSGKNGFSTLESQSILESDNLQPKMLPVWRDAITGIWQMFEGVEEVRVALRKYAIAHHFTFIFVKNEPSRVTVKCKDAQCKWKIHASQVQNTDVLRIKIFDNIHSCDPGIHQKTHPQASKKLIASIVEDKLKDTPRYRVREIINDVRRNYGISFSYQQEYRGKEIAREAIRGSLEDSFVGICGYMKKCVNTTFAYEIRTP